MEVFSTRSEVVLNCGNIASWSKIKKKALLTSTEELVSAIENTLISFTGSQTPHPITDKVFVVRSAGLAQVIPAEERDSLAITLKIFPSDWDPSQVTRAIDTSLQELGLSAVDTLILAMPPFPSHQITIDKIQLLWKAVEDSARQNKMSVIGIADLNKDELKLLFDWAKVKPRINQLNLAHCCTIPEDLAEYCKEADIKLYTHNDERTILPLPSLQHTLTETLKMEEGEGERWKYSWVSRYNSVIKCRGIVSHKGYMAELNKM